MKFVFALLVIVGLAAGGYYLRAKQLHSAAELRLRTGKVERGQVIEGVNAAGAVEPYVLVQVGTNVSGTLDKWFKDFNDKVVAGECVAIIDSRRFIAQVNQDKASVGQAQANVDVIKAKLVQAQHDLTRNRVLAEKKLVADSDLDGYIAAADSLRAQLELNAAVVSQTLAQLEGDQLNVEYCRIVSPVDGVVVARNIDVGQTVAASFNTPTLFQIANDLTKIQVQAQVPEADVGKIAKGQHAPFKVDAHPDLTFDGIVSQIRLASASVQNVVTYTIMIDAENPKELLLPGMTANATFEVAKSDPEALMVPVAALRFKPAEDLVENADAKGAVETGTGDSPGDKPHGDHARGERGEHGDRGGAAAGDPSKGPGGHTGQPRRQARNDRGRVYVKSGATKLKAIRVRIGISDGVHTVVTPMKPDELSEGTDVVLSIMSEEEEAATNPFAPRMPGGGGRR